MIIGSSLRVPLTLLTLFIGFNLLCLGTGWGEYFQYQRPAIEQGQIWRLLTAHWVHLSAMHFLLNLFGLLILWQLSAQWLRSGEKLMVLLGSMLLISLGLYLLFPQITWYRGLSGALHGLWCAAALMGLKREKGLASILLILLAIKLGWEIIAGPTPFTASLSGGPVLIQSHWLGAASGLLMAAILHLIRSKG
jgi:rhomboid family GlyGly-CTERM serine protease